MPEHVYVDLLKVMKSLGVRRGESGTESNLNMEYSEWMGTWRKGTLCRLLRPRTLTLDSPTSCRSWMLRMRHCLVKRAPQLLLRHLRGYGQILDEGKVEAPAVTTGRNNNAWSLLYHGMMLEW